MSITQSLLAKVENTIREFKMFTWGDTIVVGVSGGIDSVVLLHILNTLKDKYDWTLKVVHVNHKIRSGDAERDAEFVRSLCEKYNVDFNLFVSNIPMLAEEKGMSEEEIGHEVRYDCFKKVAGEKGKIATAHNANDNVETVLMNLMRGATLQGLQGIAYKSENICRPILGITRAELEEYLKENGLEHITDNTNYKEIYTRNKIRLSLIPFIEKNFNSNFVETLAKNIESYREDNESLSRSAEDILCLCSEVAEDNITLYYEDFNILEPAMKKRVLYLAIQKVMGEKRVKVCADRIAKICKDMSNKKMRGKVLPLSGEYHVRFDFNGLVVEKKVAQEKNESEFEFELNSDHQDITTPFGVMLHIDAVKSDCIDNNGLVIYIPYKDFVNKKMLLRTRRDGDVFRKAHDFSKSLSRVFMDNKVSKTERDKILCLVTEQQEVIWTLGYFASRFKKRSGKFFKITFEDIKNKEI